MADLSNAEVGGGVVFELKGDNGPLKATLSETKRELATATAQKYELKIGFDPQALSQLKSVFSDAIKSIQQQAIVLIKPQLDAGAMAAIKQQIQGIGSLGGGNSGAILGGTAQLPTAFQSIQSQIAGQLQYAEKQKQLNREHYARGNRPEGFLSPFSMPSPANAYIPYFRGQNDLARINSQIQRDEDRHASNMGGYAATRGSVDRLATAHLIRGDRAARNARGPSLEDIAELESSGTAFPAWKQAAMRLDRKNAREERAKLEEIEGGAHGSRGGLSHKNLLSNRGLENVGIPIGATGVFALIEGIHIAQEFAKAQSITGSRILAGMATTGSAYNIEQSPAAKSASWKLAEIQKTQAENSALERVPIVGSLYGLGNELTGSASRLEDAKIKESRKIERDKYGYDLATNRDISISEFRGDTAGSARLKREKETKAVENEASKERAVANENATDLENSAGKFGASERKRKRLLAFAREWRNTETPLEAEYRIKQADDAEMQKRDDAMQSARLAGYGASGEAATLRGGSSAIRAGAIGGTSQAAIRAQLAATALEQKATEKEVIRSNNDALAKLQGNPAEQSKLADQFGQQAIERERKNAEAIKGIREQLAQDLLAIDQRMYADRSKISQDLIANQSQGNQNRLLISRQFFEAKKQGLSDSYAAETDSAEKTNEAEIRGLIGKHAGAGEIFSALGRQAIAGFRRQSKFGMDKDLMNTQEDQRVSQSVLDSTASSQSSVLKSGGFNWEAHIASRNHEQYNALGKIENSTEWHAKLADFRANNATEESNHKFELQDRKIARDADFASAVDRQKDLPISGQIEQAAAAARLAIRNADPSEREDVRKTEMAKFRATEHELLGLHGGGYAAKGSAFFTPGDPLGLGKGAEDRENAQKQAAEDEKKIQAEQGKDVANGVKGILDALNKLFPNLPFGLLGNS